MHRILSKMAICENTNFLTLFLCYRISAIGCILMICLVMNVKVQASASLFTGATNNKFLSPLSFYNMDGLHYGSSADNENVRDNASVGDKSKQKRFVFSSFGWGAGGVPAGYGSRLGNNNINAFSAKGKRFVFSSFGWGAAGVPRIEDFQASSKTAAAAAVSDESSPETQNNKFRHNPHEQIAIPAASDPNLYRWLHSNNNNKPISQRSTHSEMLMTQTLPSENGPTQNDKDQRRIRSSSFVKQKKHNKYSSAAAQTLIALVRLLSAQNNNNNNSTHQTHRWTSQLQSPPYSQSAAVVSSPPAASLSNDNSNMLPHAAYELAL